MDIAYRLLCATVAAWLVATIITNSHVLNAGLLAQLKAPQYAASLRWSLLTLLVWLTAFGTIGWINSDTKWLWYATERPSVGFLAKLSLLSIVLWGAISLTLGLTCDTSSCSSAASPIAVLLTGALATVGWNYTAFENRRSEIRRSTMETINKMMDDPAHERLQTAFYLGAADKALIAETNLYDQYQVLHAEPNFAHCLAHFATGQKPPETMRAGDKTRLARICHIYAFAKYGDFLERFALLYRLGRIDERLAQEMMGDSVAIYCHTMTNYIGNAQRCDKAYYENLEWLKKDWRRKGLGPKDLDNDPATPAPKENGSRGPR